MKKEPLEIGKTYRVVYPFVRDMVEMPEFDGEKSCCVEVHGWRPGCEKDRGEDFYGYADLAADAHGEMLLTVISLHKPGKYPERVFFTRSWRDPDGKEFGKDKLRITATSAFRRLLKGYRHDYYCDGEAVARSSA